MAGLFKWRLFEPKVILLAVGWYLRFSLSRIATLRNLGEEACAPITSRCGDGHVPEMERRLRRRLKPTNDSWSVDETYVRVKRIFFFFAM